MGASSRLSLSSQVHHQSEDRAAACDRSDIQRQPRTLTVNEPTLQQPLMVELARLRSTPTVPDTIPGINSGPVNEDGVPMTRNRYKQKKEMLNKSAT